MFSERDGPTALRPDLVRALSVSSCEVKLEAPDGPQRACAAVSGVWNGKRGYVAILIRRLDQPVLKRFTHAEALISLAALDETVSEALAFATELGFSMDPAEFLGLSEERKRERLSLWDDVRNFDRQPQLESPPRPRAVASAAGRDGGGGRSVLGRVSVVRAAAASARSRLLAQF